MSEIRQSFCVLDCPDACSLDVEVEDGRVVALDGNAKNPVTGGYICGKVRAQMVDHLYGEARLRQPLMRRGAKGEGDFAEVSWDTALATIAERLVAVRDEFGGEAILPVSYGGSNGFLTQDNTDARLFRRLGASRLVRTVCAAPSTSAAAGLYGKMPGIAIQDYADAAATLVWGVNPAVTGMHLMAPLQEAKAKGGWLGVIDPRRTPAARIADLHLAVRPGTDLPVALSIINWLFSSGNADTAFLARHATGIEKLRQRAAAWSFADAAAVAGVEAADIQLLAERYAVATPAALRCGWGLERNRNGGSAVAAVLALPAVAGKFGVRSGGYTMSNAAAWNIDPTVAAATDEARTRVINMNRVGETLRSAEPPIKALFVYNCNALATLPDQGKMRRGLQRDDLFTVVYDQVMTDTARYADVVLPATSFLEHHELRRGYGAYLLYQSAPVADRVGASRPNHEVFTELCERTGVARADDPKGDAALIGAMLSAAYPEDGVADTLAAGDIVTPEFGDRPTQFVDVFPLTPDGKIHLVPEHLDNEAAYRGGLYHYVADPGDEEFPLALISPATKKLVSSTFGQLNPDIVPVQIHPDDAARRAIDAGDEVRVFNARGEVVCTAAINPALRRGVAVIPKGTWDHNTRSGNTANVLVADDLTDIAGGACFNDARVEIAATA